MPHWHNLIMCQWNSIKVIPNIFHSRQIHGCFISSVCDYGLHDYDQRRSPNWLQLSHISLPKITGAKSILWTKSSLRQDIWIHSLSKIRIILGILRLWSSPNFVLIWLWDFEHIKTSFRPSFPQKRLGSLISYIPFRISMISLLGAFLSYIPFQVYRP